MKTYWWGLLALGLTACGKQVEVASGIVLMHRHDGAIQRQVELLQAEQVKVSVPTGGSGPAVLSLEVLNPYSSLEQHPDTLKQRMRKLAHLVVADLGGQPPYQVVNAQATFKHSLFARDNSTSSQAFIYPIASLR